ncbi:VPS4-associated protein 1 [Desarmillaria tabescens]|uniref:VPS4-associated protein 1 n=1 Tax=Armillaria tabescens TaxID=1929756 RepID=A0AA39NLT9_ARMTA|nr:VPS4-associated protein 1 [Desarmillaria tabescens]KAK0467930.1 VPS4-associated protein 1 [Desarmillaria tabescens]
MSFTNLYYKRTTGTPKACYICYKPTTTCLATINAVDFLYTCPTHLTDRGFASPIQEEPAKPAVDENEIAKVKEEWEEKQKRKAEREKEKEKEKEKADKVKDKDDDKDKKEKEKKSTPPKSPHSSVSPPPTPAAHQRFALHRDIFAMRQTEHRRRRQAAQAKDLAPRFPGAPRGELA